MTQKWLRNLSLITVLGLAWAALAACVNDVAFGQAFAEGNPAGQAGQDWATAVSIRGQADRCASFTSVVTCLYTIGGQPITATSYFVGTDVDTAYENFIDPLILEVPDNVVSTTGAYDTGSGPQPLLIDRTGSFPVEPNHRITAEVSTTFLILSVPRSVTDNLPVGNPPSAPVFSYTLSFHQLYPLGATVPAVTIKPLQAGEVSVLWRTFYTPFFPCIYDYVANPFAAIPPLTIPKASSPQDLSPTLVDLISHGAVSPCRNVVYNYTFATPPPGLVFLPLARR